MNTDGRSCISAMESFASHTAAAATGLRIYYFAIEAVDAHFDDFYYVIILRSPIALIAKAIALMTSSFFDSPQPS